MVKELAEAMRELSKRRANSGVERKLGLDGAGTEYHSRQESSDGKAGIVGGIKLITSLFWNREWSDILDNLGEVN